MQTFFSFAKDITLLKCVNLFNYSNNLFVSIIKIDEIPFISDLYEISQAVELSTWAFPRTSTIDSYDESEWREKTALKYINIHKSYCLTNKMKHLIYFLKKKKHEFHFNCGMMEIAVVEVIIMDVQNGHYLLV